jgi:flavin reductase (DIM6/NTAB) family NADH-FMN oxidoreductase RutF
VKKDKQSIGRAIGRIPSGCMIVTAQHGGQSTGLLASWVQQSSFEPPAVTVCIKPTRPIAELIDGSRRFVINVIGEGTAVKLMRQFGRGFAPGENAFEGLEIESSDYGPVLSECVAHLGCRLTNKICGGDHDIYIGEIEAGDGNDNARPFVHVRTSGLSY